MADTPGGNEFTLTGTTPVTVVAAPGASTQRIVTDIEVFNADSVSHTFIFKKVKTATKRTFRKVVVPADNPYTWKGRMVLDATDESVEVEDDATATTLEPVGHASYMETT